MPGAKRSSVDPGMSDEAVAAKTGKRRAEWVRTLDAAGAGKLKGYWLKQLDPLEKFLSK